MAVNKCIEWVARTAILQTHFLEKNDFRFDSEAPKNPTNLIRQSSSVG